MTTPLEHARLGHLLGPEDPAVIDVRFLEQHDVYNAGDIAHFPQVVADELVARRVAAFVTPPLDKMERGRRTK